MINGCISMAILTVNNLRDIESDRNAGKRSLIVRFGKRFGEFEYLFLYLLAFPFLLMANSPKLSFLIILAGVMLYLKLRKTKGKSYNKMLIFTGLSNILFVLLYLLDNLLF
jgi:1,4-dihydroxy-2-naphthoate octaprenyltransferase